jgi:hypothetical protein
VCGDGLAYAWWDGRGEFLLKESANQGKALSAEWLTLLECAKPNVVPGRLTECLRKPLDWSRLLMLADEHGILPLLSSRFGALDRGAVPLAILQQLRDASRAQTLFTLSLTAELFRVLERLDALGIPALLTKGPVLSARCYGDPGLRQYTDLDLVIRDVDILRATEAMIGLRYQPKVPLQAIRAEKSPGEYVFVQSDNNLLVEFHSERTFRYHPRPLSIDKVFDRQARVPFDGHDVPALSTEDELILISIHGAKHFWERLMWIADVAALVSRQTIDWNLGWKAACEVQAQRMLRVALLLATNILGARLPSQVVDDFRGDRAAVSIAAEIARRLPDVEAEPFSLFGRAAFRVRMRGGTLPGFAYLLRLALAPTEEDWAGSGDTRPRVLDAISRPLRLARKYGREKS